LIIVIYYLNTHDELFLIRGHCHTRQYDRVRKVVT